RNEAHFATGRKTDLLSLELQPDLASNLGYQAKGGLLASEIFMRDYYRRASELHAVAARFLLRHLTVAPRRAPRRRSRATGPLAVHPPASGAAAPALLAAFIAAQAAGTSLSEEGKHDIAGRLELVSGELRASRDACRAFLRLFARRGRVAETVRAMHESGFLGRFLPEWARITFLVQHDHFHRYTVDEHTLKCIEALDDLAAGSSATPTRLGSVLDEVGDVTPLYLGVLLHDIGKGRGSGHVPRGVRIGGRILARLHAEASLREDVLFLIGAHPEMSQLAQHRDLSEPRLIEAFARRVGTVRRLDLLLLLTYADHSGVAPGIWNEWKASLLLDLYARTRERLLGRGGDVAGEASARSRALRTLLAELPAAEVEPHFGLLPERYLRSTDARHMVRHFHLVRRLGEQPLALEWRDPADGGCTELTLAAAVDRPGLFAAVAGTLTAHGINILSVDLCSRADGVAIEAFRFGEPGGHWPSRDERRRRVEASLREAVAGRLDVHAAVEAWRARRPQRARRH
ncbi:MAG TPA: ACT domain-containing protein, partial [Thermoanaerobaculia bacterium]|nr:ACT domain-containing protein [Thermoanaerobaculia bacterium]